MLAGLAGESLISSELPSAPHTSATVATRISVLIALMLGSMLRRTIP